MIDRKVLQSKKVKITECFMFLDISARKTPRVKEKLKIKSTKNKKNSVRRKIKATKSVSADLEVNFCEVKIEFNEKSDKTKEPKPSSMSRCSFIK